MTPRAYLRERENLLVFEREAEELTTITDEARSPQIRDVIFVLRPVPSTRFIFGDLTRLEVTLLTIERIVDEKVRIGRINHLPRRSGDLISRTSALVDTYLTNEFVSSTDPNTMDLVLTVTDLRLSDFLTVDVNEGIRTIVDEGEHVPFVILSRELRSGDIDLRSTGLDLKLLRRDSYVTEARIDLVTYATTSFATQDGSVI